MANHREYQKGPKTEGKHTEVTNLTYTQSRTFQFSMISSSLPVAVAATLILFNCSLTWSFIMAT